MDSDLQLPYFKHLRVNQQQQPPSVPCTCPMQPCIGYWIAGKSLSIFFFLRSGGRGGIVHTKADDRFTINLFSTKEKFVGLELGQNDYYL